MSGGILVALDGSAAAESALPYAQLLARVQQRRLLLVRAVAATAGEGGGGDRAALLGAEAYLAAVAGRLMTGAAVEAIAFTGQPEEAILAEARLRQAGLIALAVDPRSPASSALSGATAQRVLAAADVPTLFVPVGSRCNPALPVQARRVLIPLDGSAFAEAALWVGLGLARALGVGVLLLYCVTPHASRSLVDGVRPDSLGATEGGAYLAARQARLARQEPGIPVTIAVRQGPPGEQIVRAATEHGVLVVVMATHGEGGSRPTVLGSVAADVLQHAVVPQLLVRPHGAELAPGKDVA